MVTATRTTPIPHRLVGAPSVTRWIGGVDIHPDSDPEAADGIDQTPVVFTPGNMVDMYAGDGSPKGMLVFVEVIAPASADILWVCLGGAYDHARAWPIYGGEHFEHIGHLQGIEQVSFRATAADGTSNPSAAIKPRIKAEWDRRG